MKSAPTSRVTLDAHDSRGPIFVAGQERSGTSLIYALLGSHPRISMTRRLNWWTFFDGHFGDLSDDAHLDRCLDAMMRYRRHLKLEPDRKGLREEFVAGPRTYGRLLELLARQRADRVGKPRWGDKSLHTERYADRVFEEFPDARIVHMIRDPRDRFASALKRWDGGLGGVGVATTIWIRSVDWAERQAARYPGSYMMLRYEDLVREPEAQLRRVCAFIGERYEPEMLGMGGDPDFREASNSSFGPLQPGVISTASVGRFREVLAPWQIAYIQSRAGDRMRRLGYHLEPVAMPARARMAYRLLHHPWAVSLGLAWSLREAFYDRTGRSPSAHTILEESERDVA